MSNLSTQPYKGTRDFYPEDMRIRNWIFEHMKKVCRSYGYEEYDGPMLESFDLYAAKSGEEIVNNELYSFEDKGGRKVAMRPEMTPTVARMVAAKVQELPKPIRWFSIPNLWRYEAPQKGRLREHWQLNVDIFGVELLDAEAEVLKIARDILTLFGADNSMYECKINNRKLLDSAFDKIGIFDNEEDKKRYKVSKAIDKKDKVSSDDFKTMLGDAGCSDEEITAIEKYLNSTLDEVKMLVGEDNLGYQELVTLFEILNLEDGNTFAKFSPGLMRGFDYYTGTVFEFYDTNPENRRAMFGGGRYDDLVSIFNGQKIPAFGFGMGDVTARDFLDTHNLTPKLKSDIDVLITTLDDSAKLYITDISNKLRAKNLNVVNYVNPDKLDKQLKFANQKGIKYVIIAGSDEMGKGIFKLKNMDERTETEIKIEEIDGLEL